MGSRRRKGFAWEFDPSACEACQGRCCRGSSGNVWISGPEVDALSSFLQMTQIEVIERYLVRMDGRLTLREKILAGESACIFFDEDAAYCSIYPVRPAQCRSFPFWEYYRGREVELCRECPGVRRFPETS